MRWWKLKLTYRNSGAIYWVVLVQDILWDCSYVSRGYLHLKAWLEENPLQRWHVLLAVGWSLCSSLHEPLYRFFEYLCTMASDSPQNKWPKKESKEGAALPFTTESRKSCFVTFTLFCLLVGSHSVQPTFEVIRFHLLERGIWMKLWILKLP